MFEIVFSVCAFTNLKPNSMSKNLAMSIILTLLLKQCVTSSNTRKHFVKKMAESQELYIVNMV